MPFRLCSLIHLDFSLPVTTAVRCRCEAARLKHLIDDFVQEMTTSLEGIPAEMRVIEKELIAKSSPDSEIEKGIEAIRNDPLYLRSFIIDTLIRKVFKLLNDSLPEPLRGRDHYVGVFDKEGIRLVPRSMVESKQQ